MSVLVISATLVILAVLATYVLLNHKDFQETEYRKTYCRSAFNEDTQGDQVYQITKDPNGRQTKKCQNVPKQVIVNWQRYYRNC